MLSDDSGQAGGLITVVAGIFIMGFFYVAFGAIMNQINVTNNDFIGGSMPYSQERHTAMNQIFQYWYGFPILAILIFAIWGIKNALTKEPSEI